MIRIVQSLNEPNVFYLWSDTYLIISSLKDFCVYTTLPSTPPPTFCVKFIPFTFSPCEPPILKKNQLAEFISSEGALYVILPYDYPARSGTHFLNTHRSLTTTLSIDALMTLLTVISMKTKITKMTISDDNF